MSLYRDYIQLSEIVPLSFISDLQNKWRVFIVYCLALITIQFHGPSVYMYIKARPTNICIHTCVIIMYTKASSIMEVILSIEISSLVIFSDPQKSLSKCHIFQ